MFQSVFLRLITSEKVFKGNEEKKFSTENVTLVALSGVDIKPPTHSAPLSFPLFLGRLAHGTERLFIPVACLPLFCRLCCLLRDICDWFVPPSSPSLSCDCM